MRKSAPKVSPSTSSTASRPAPDFSPDDLHAYQLHAVEYIKRTPHSALWLDMGLGKTVITLTALADLLDECISRRVLVIAPLRVARSVWPVEGERWSHLGAANLQVQQILGTPAQRKEQLAASADVYVINRELVPWLVELYGRKDWPFDTVVIDEATAFKNPASQRFKALKKVRPQIERMIQLTGTPASNGLLDLWSQVYLLDRGHRLGKTFSGFRSKYFMPDFMGYHWTLKKGAADEIHALLSDICLRMSSDDYLSLPDSVPNTVAVEPSRSVYAQYREFEREFLLKLGPGTVDAPNAAALTNKLLQFANGAVYTETAWEEVHTLKLDALEELREGVDGPILVAYNYRHDLERIRARFPEAVILDHEQSTVDRWNRREIDMLVAHPASAGHGLNLQSGGNNIVWFGLNWSLELYDQFNARLRRQGQDRPVFVHHIVTQGTVDETVMGALRNKTITQSALLDALRADIQRKIGE